MAVLAVAQVDGTVVNAALIGVLTVLLAIVGYFVNDKMKSIDVGIRHAVVQLERHIDDDAKRFDDLHARVTSVAGRVSFIEGQMKEEE